MKYTLCFIAYNRQKFLVKICEQLAGIDARFKEQLCVKILNDHNFSSELMKDILAPLDAQNIACENVHLPNPSYFNKCVYMSSEPSEFIISCDEDIYLTTEGWNNFFKGAERLPWNTIGTYAPLITSGIPSVELFLDNFVDLETAAFFREEFSKTHIPNMWGANYEHLKYDKEDYCSFFALADQTQHYYKGIHPLRVNSNLQRLLMNYILCNPSWKNPNIEHNLMSMGAPYFCNSVYMMPTAEYKNVIDGILKGEFTFDTFDEVGLNQYIKKHNKQFVFNFNAVAVHPSYNTIGRDYVTISEDFFENI